MTFAVPGYRVQRLLGVGSQGEVWLGEELGSGEPVALKRIPLDHAAAAEAARTEAALLAALDHPSLIALRAYVPLERAAVLVLELAAAGTLAGLLARRRRLTPPEVVATISPVASGLAHAHDAGVLHGDVSAANILFTPLGRAKLADLGMARLLAAAVEPALGTPAYLDPTIAAGGPAGVASDVFSLAAVALHALTGAGPWSRPDQPAPSAEDVLAVAATGRPVDLPGRLRPLPSDMAKVLLRALDRDPARRGSAAELALDLRASLPPASVMLAGGRIAGRARPGQPALAPGADQLSYVPADLTHIARRRPASDVAGVLRAGGLAGPDSAPDVPALADDRYGMAVTRRVAAVVRRLPTALVGCLRSFAGCLMACTGRFASFAGRLLAFAGRVVGLWRRVKPADRQSFGMLAGGARRGQPAGRHRAVRPGGQPHANRPAMAVRPASPARWAWRGSPARPPRAAWRGPAAAPRPARLIAALLVAGTLAMACSIGWPRLHQRPAAASMGERVAHARPAAGSSVPPRAGSPADPSIAPGSQPPATLPAAAHPSVAELEGILAGLAAVRQQAFAQRRPALLAAAYASPTLLAADTAQLLHGVPAGCQLAGLHTSYRDVRALPTVGGTAASGDARPASAGGTKAGGTKAGGTKAGGTKAGGMKAGASARSAPVGTATGDGGQPTGATPDNDDRWLVVGATATLSTATLSCAGTVRGHSRPAGPMRLRLVLTDDGHGWRIASQRLG